MKNNVEQTNENAIVKNLDAMQMGHLGAGKPKRLIHANNMELESKARIAFMRAKQNGLIKTKPCEVCGSLESEAHHEDYAKPLEVIWLCPKHHKLRHCPPDQKCKNETKNMIPNPHAQALGKLGKGRPKTMTPEAIEQRRAATKARLKIAKERKKHANKNLHAKSVTTDNQASTRATTTAQTA